MSVWSKLSALAVAIAITALPLVLFVNTDWVWLSGLSMTISIISGYGSLRSLRKSQERADASMQQLLDQWRPLLKPEED